MRVYRPGCRAILQVILDGFGGDAADSDILVVPVLPKTATIHRNSYNQADSYELGFDARDLPFDPRMVRAGSAEIYLYQSDSLDAAPAVLSRKDPLAEPDPGAARVRTAIETVALDVGLASSKERFTYGNKPLIAGLFDRDRLEMSPDGKWVTLNGQDYTAHLASLQWKPDPNGVARRIPVGKRVDELIGELLAEADPGGTLATVVLGIEEDDLPIVGEGDVRGSARGIPVEQDTTYWDVIYRVAIRCGLICYVDGVDVVITRPKTILNDTQTSIKRLAWGRNIEHLTLERELGREQAPTIVVKSYDPVSRNTIVVEYPPGQIDRSRIKPPDPMKIRGTQKTAKTTEKHRAKPAKSKGKTTTTLRKRDEYQIIPVYGVTDRKVLERMAENRYHLIGRAERRCVAKTRDLRDMRDSDMLSLGAGDAVTIEWDEFNREIMASPNVPEETKVSHLVARGFARPVAELVARRYSQLEGLDRPLRVKEATYRWDVDDGIEIELELFDFIVVDGIRPDDGAPRPTSADARARMTTNDVRTVGYSPEKRAAEIRRHRP